MPRSSEAGEQAERETSHRSYIRRARGSLTAVSVAVRATYCCTMSDRPRRIRRLLAGGVALALAATIVPASSASLTVSGTLFSPATVDASTPDVLYYLQMRSGAAQELFSVAMIPPPFATVGGGGLGSSLDGPTAVALQGPGTLGNLVQAPDVITPCSDRPAAFHGYATGAASVDVLLPPDSATTLAVRYDTGRRAPWIDTDFKLTFTVATQLVGTYPAGSPFAGAPTVTTPVTMTTAGPTVAGRIGVQILLETTPHAPARIAPGAGIAISGRILPGRSGRRIDFEWTRSGGALTELARRGPAPMGVSRSRVGGRRSPGATSCGRATRASQAASSRTRPRARCDSRWRETVDPLEMDTDDRTSRAAWRQPPPWPAGSGPARGRRAVCAPAPPGCWRTCSRPPRMRTSG